MGKSNQGEQKKTGKGAQKIKAVVKTAVQHLKEKIEQGIIVKPVFVVVKCVSSHIENQYRTVLARDTKKGEITLDGRLHFRVVTVEPTTDAASLRSYCEGKNRFRGVKINPREAVEEQARSGSILAAMAIARAKMEEVETGKPVITNPRRY